MSNFYGYGSEKPPRPPYPLSPEDFGCDLTEDWDNSTDKKSWPSSEYAAFENRRHAPNRPNSPILSQEVHRGTGACSVPFYRAPRSFSPITQGQPYHPAFNLETPDSLNNCPHFATFSSSPPEQRYNQYYGANFMHFIPNVSSSSERQLIRKLSVSPPKPPSALTFNSCQDRSFGGNRRRTTFSGSAEPKNPNRSLLQPSFTPPATRQRAIYSCPPSPRLQATTHLFNESGEAFTSQEEDLEFWQTAFPVYSHPASGQDYVNMSSAQRRETPEVVDQQPELAIEGNKLDHFTPTSSRVGRDVNRPRGGAYLVNNDEEAAETSILKQDPQETAGYSAALNNPSGGVTSSPFSSYVKGGSASDSRPSDPISVQYKEWYKLLLPEKPNSSTKRGGHRPLTESRSAEPSSEQQMVRQGSDKRLFLTPWGAEQSPKLPQRSRSLKSNSGQRRSAAKSQPAVSGLIGDHRKTRERTGSMPECANTLTSYKTPSVARRGGSFRTKRDRIIPEKRLDEWPQPEVNPHTQRFLQLPDADEYARLRSFTIDEKGCVISRGDSFRLRSNTKTDSNSGRSGNGSLRSGSPDALASEESDCGLLSEMVQKPERSFVVMVLGSEGCGKTSLINQFMTSEHRNPFSTELDNPSEAIVSIVIEGRETELKFKEVDSEKESMWLAAPCSAYLVLYSVDSKSSFKYATGCISDIKERRETVNIPVILAANKIDLARTRVVQKQEARSAAQSFQCDHYEFSVTLNHGVNEILIGVLAEINGDQKRPRVDPGDGFRLSIKRFSQRKQRQSSKKRGTGSVNEKSESRQSTKATKDSSSKDKQEVKKKTQNKGENCNSKSGDQGAKNTTSVFTGFMSKILKRHGSKPCEKI